MEKVKTHKMPLQITLFLFMCAALLSGQLLYTLSRSLIESTMRGLMTPSPDAIVFKEGRNITVWLSQSMPSGGVEITNQQAFDALKILYTLCPVLIFGICVLIATYLFCRIKMKKSLDTLTTGIAKIGRQELDFQMHSNARDELGELCNAFEKMRGQLADTFRALWTSEEDRRNLSRAFAHDLRTPLTVIKGNNEIIEYVAAKNNDWQKAIEAVTVSNQAINRIETYAEQLKTLDSIDELVPQYTKIDLQEFIADYQQQAEIVSASYQKAFHMSCNERISIIMDCDIVTRVLDNLLVNALQYAKQSVWLNIGLLDDKLKVTLSDDGGGFSGEALKHAIKPFFTTDKTKHMGIGLTIASRLLARMDSSLQISNQHEGGAEISFFLMV